jgi:hypothetical protein
MDLETIRAKHIPVPVTMTKREPQPLMCTSCCDPWPCDTEKVLGEVDRLRKALAAYVWKRGGSTSNNPHRPPAGEGRGGVDGRETDRQMHLRSLMGSP